MANIQFEDLNSNPSERYSKYTKKLLIFALVMFISFFIGFILIGIICLIVCICLPVFMPKDLREEAKVYNLRQEKLAEKYKDNMDEIIPRLYDKEYSLKEKLMQKFLSIFGDFEWQKYKSFFRIEDLVIIPSKL